MIFNLIGLIGGAGGSAISVTDTIDPVSGGIIRTITAVSLAGDTVTASVLLNGYTAHDAEGNEITGEYVPPSPSLQQKTVSPTESQILVEPDAGYDGLEDVTVNAISSSYVGSGVTRQAAQTIHPSTSDQTIASGRYLTGDQTIKAVTVSELIASNILSGVTVKVGDSTDDDCVASVSGSVAFQTIYSGSSAPSSAQGVDGDVYIQT